MRIYTKLYLHWVKEQNMGGYTQEFGSLRLSRLLRSLSRVYDSCWDWEQGLVVPCCFVVKALLMERRRMPDIPTYRSVQKALTSLTRAVALNSLRHWTFSTVHCSSDNKANSFFCCRQESQLFSCAPYTIFVTQRILHMQLYYRNTENSFRIKNKQLKH